MPFKNLIITLFTQKIWLLKQITNNVRSITKSDPAIQIEPVTYCNVTLIFFLEKMASEK